MVETNILFDRAKEEFCRLMTGWGLWHHELMDVLNRYDIFNVRQCCGFAKECFPTALIQTYLHYSAYFDREESNDELDRLFSLGWDVLYEKPVVMEGAVSLLEGLSKTHHLFLLTKGDHDLQDYKIKESGLAGFFQQIYIFPEKNSRTFQEVIAEQSIDPRESWSVGNSIKADINPGLQVGLQCIHLQTPSWDFEFDKPAGDFFPVKKLREVATIIRQAGTSEKVFTKIKFSADQ